MHPVAFLRQHHPFSELDDEGAAALGQAVQIIHVPAGDAILTEDGAPATAVGVIRKGALELVTGDVVVDQLEPGEMYGLTSVMTRRPPSMTVRAVEDTLCYEIPASVARRVLSSGSAVASVWAIARQRARAADAVARTVRGADPRFARIGSLVRRPAVTIDPGASVADAATRMRDERVSCLVIDLGASLAIVTDNDLRTRVVAERGSFDRPVVDIATEPVHTVPADTLAGEALLEMLTQGIHHLPVVERDRVIGVVTDTDLLGLEATSPFAIRGAIERARTDADVIAGAEAFPAVVADLIEAGVDPVDVGRVVSVIGDAATQRLLRLATHDLGDPPCPFAWIALGSAARREGELDADQDHALAFGPGFAEEHDAYFATLAERVTAGLEAIGFPRCHGDAMAVHPAMRASLPEWAERFRTWIRRPDADALILSSIGFDFRAVAGALDADATLDAAVADARTDPAFLLLLARVALREEPPTGFVRGLVVGSTGEHAGTLDLKHGGIIIVTAIARARAIAAGASAKDTLSRLEAAVAGGTVSADSGADLAESFRFLLDLRLRHQAARVRAGQAPDGFVDPAELGTIERSGLREAFRTIRGEQELLRLELGVR